MFADLIFASVWAVVVVLKFAMAYVSPSGIVIDGVTVPTVVSELVRAICTPAWGALAGEPVESCS